MFFVRDFYLSREEIDVWDVYHIAVLCLKPCLQKFERAYSAADPVDADIISLVDRSFCMKNETCERIRDKILEAEENEDDDENHDYNCDCVEDYACQTECIER